MNRLIFLHSNTLPLSRLDAIADRLTGPLDAAATAVLFRKALRASVIADEIGEVGPAYQEKLRQGVEQERRNLVYRLSVVRTFVRGKLAAVRALTNSVYERLDNYIVEAIKMQNAAVNEAVSTNAQETDD